MENLRYITQYPVQTETYCYSPGSLPLIERYFSFQQELGNESDEELTVIGADSVGIMGANKCNIAKTTIAELNKWIS